jgi:hypothetical protein
MTSARLKWAALAALAACAVSCTKPAGATQGTTPAGQTPITGDSKTLDVSGSYWPIVLENVDHLAREEGHVLVYGPSKGIVVDVPSDTDMSQPNPSWRLVTENNAGDTRRVTFTHATSLEEFSIDLPKSPAELHYGAFLLHSGGSVLIFAWGEEWHSYWGYVTIRETSR